MDFVLLRRDEIWFVNKKIDKAYLEGRYGGVPVFSTVFPVKED